METSKWLIFLLESGNFSTLLHFSEQKIISLFSRKVRKKISAKKHPDI